MKKFKSKKDWIRYCEKNFVYQHPDYKDCPKGIIFYGQVGNNNDWYDWFKYEGNGNISWDFFDVWEENELPKNIRPFNNYYIDKQKGQ
jgi:hypothetical protein